MRERRREAAITLRVVLLAVALLAGAGLLAKHFLIDSGDVPQSSGYVFDLQRVRSLATGAGGPLPDRVNAARVAEAQVPRGAAIAGAGLEALQMLRSAFQVVYPDGATLLIDTAYDRELHESRSEGQPFDDEQYEAVQRAMHRADAIVVTHEHPDHLGGLGRSPQLPELLGHALLTAEQVSDPQRLASAGFPDRALEGYEPLRYRGLHAPMPGVVLIKAPGHTPGSQIVYVQLASGAELLFVGDIAWNMRNIDELVGRPLLVARFLLGEDRAAVQAQLRSLHELLEREPSLQVVVAHDGEQLEEHVAAGHIRLGFE